MEYTYNENGLPETIEIIWAIIKTTEPMLLRIAYKQKVGTTDNNIAKYFSIPTNPTSLDALASFGLLESGDITLEICDMLV